MAQQIINNGESGLSVRTKINENFAEVYAKTGYIRDMRDFGVVADAVTDDTAAINAAIDAMEAQGGGILWAPPGGVSRTTGITRTAQNGKPWLIATAGKGAYTIRKMGAGTSPVFTLNGPGSPSGAEWFGGFSGVSFDGLSTSASEAALRLNGVARCVTDRLLFLNSFRGCEIIGSLILNFNDCAARNNGDGYYAINSVPLALYSNLITWNGGESRGNAGWGFNLGGGEAHRLSDIDVSGNGTAGTGFTGAVLIRSTTDDESGVASILLENLYIEANKSRAVLVENNPGLRLRVQNTGVFGHIPVAGFPPIEVAGAASVSIADSRLLCDTALNASRSAVMESLVVNLTDTSAVRYHRNVSGSGADTRYSVANGALQADLNGFAVLGNTPRGKFTLPANATDLASVITLGNQLRAMAVAFGFTP
jgi:polygalacturonase